MSAAAPHSGLRNLITDVGGLSVGSAHNEVVRTGVTVIRPTARAVCAVDVRGGGPGTRETDALAPDTLVDAVDAVILSGGSVYGLAAADGVAAKLGASGEGFTLLPAPGVPVSPITPAAILYDLANGGDKAWGLEPPYRSLGMAALDAVSTTFALGRAGAGYGARAGAGLGGLGSTSLQGSDGARVGALVAVNSFGAVRQPGTNAFWAWPYEQNGEFGGARPWDEGALASVDGEDWGAAKTTAQPGENTTIAVVATDVALTPAQARRVAVMAQDGLARAIRPAHAPFDGDVVFALSTAQRPLPAQAPDLHVARLGNMAADALARAIARGVWEAERS